MNRLTTITDETNSESIDQEDTEYREAQKALWRESQQRRRRSEARRKVVGEALQEEEREREADLTASKEEGMRDVEAYRQVWGGRERRDAFGGRNVVGCVCTSICHVSSFKVCAGCSLGCRFFGLLCSDGTMDYTVFSSSFSCGTIYHITVPHYRDTRSASVGIASRWTGTVRSSSMTGR